MIKGTKEELEQITATHVCPEHGASLCVAWHAGEKSYVIRCGDGHFPEEVTRRLTPTQKFKAGQLQKVDPLFNLLPKVDLATGVLLTPEEMSFLVTYAKKYGLDAYRGHVTYMYGKPYIGIDGYLYHANQQKIPYQLRSRPLDEGEREAMQLGEKDHGWKAEITKLTSNEYFVGMGIVTQEEITAKSTKRPEQLRSPVVAAHPWQLAQKRAEWQALRRAFPIGESEKEQSES